TSERAYLERWSGPLVARILKAVEKPLPASADPIWDAAIEAPPGTWIEASPLPSFDTAAGHRVKDGLVSVPHSIRVAYRSDVLYLRIIDGRTGAVLATHARSKMSL